jgi:hypothetical protein
MVPVGDTLLAKVSSVPPDFAIFITEPVFVVLESRRVK